MLNDIVKKTICIKSDKGIRHLIETGTLEEIENFITTNCKNCPKLEETGCDGLAWLDDIFTTESKEKEVK